MKKFFAKNSSGFSLVELLIVLAIIFIMTGVLFSNNADRKAAGDVEAVARQIATQVRALQNEALAGKRIGNDYAKKYKFNITSATGYNASYENSSGTLLQTSPTIDLSAKRVNISGDIADFNFTSPLATANNGSQGIITVTSTAVGSVKMCVKISAKGDVTEEKC